MNIFDLIKEHGISTAKQFAKAMNFDSDIFKRYDELQKPFDTDLYTSYGRRNSKFVTVTYRTITKEVFVSIGYIDKFGKSHIKSSELATDFVSTLLAMGNHAHRDSITEYSIMCISTYWDCIHAINNK